MARIRLGFDRRVSRDTAHECSPTAAIMDKPERDDRNVGEAQLFAKNWFATPP
jgi:hypothetical protein